QLEVEVGLHHAVGCRFVEVFERAHPERVFAIGADAHVAGHRALAAAAGKDASRRGDAEAGIVLVHAGKRTLVSVAKFTVLSHADVAPGVTYPAPYTAATGVLDARRVSPERYSTWLVDADLDGGATLTWSAAHGDEGVYVASGALDVDGRECPADGAL